MRISALVPAHNEAETIGNVLDVLLRVSSIDRVLVVDDGSQDETSRIAQEHGAEVLRLHPNGGKGKAMLAGVRYLQPTDAILFCDSDLLGLTTKHIDDLISAFFNLDADQAVGLRSHDFGWLLLPAAAAVTDLISGERIVRTDVLAEVPLSCWSGYAIETAINKTVDRLGGTTAVVPMRGLDMRVKGDKVGALQGMRRNYRMFVEIERTKASLSACNECGTVQKTSPIAAGYGAVAVAGTLVHLGVRNALDTLKESIRDI